jgi:hypothetical protein
MSVTKTMESPSPYPAGRFAVGQVQPQTHAQPDSANHHQDHANDGEVDTGCVGCDRKLEDRPERDREQTYSDSHFSTALLDALSIAGACVPSG